MSSLYDGAFRAAQDKQQGSAREAPDPKKCLMEEIRSALNRYSAENGSNTPDFILAQYLIACLAAFDAAVQQRSAWYDHRTGEPPKETPPRVA